MLYNPKEVCVLSIDQLVAIHTNKKEKAKHYSRQLTYVMALVCFVFFGTILSYQATSTNTQAITGMAVAAGSYISSGELAESTKDVSGFVTAVKTSPQVTEIKLFFYTVWILVVLVGTAISYEFRERI